jgi:hypothetical protein
MINLLKLVIIIFSHRSLWPLLLCRHAGSSKHLVHPLPQRLPTLAKDEWSVDLQRSSNGLQTIVGSRWGRGRSNCLYVCIKKILPPPPGELDLLWTPARDQRRTSCVLLHWQLLCLLCKPQIIGLSLAGSLLIINPSM